jgi:hypothetical protein
MRPMVTALVVAHGELRAARSPRSTSGRPRRPRANAVRIIHI